MNAAKYLALASPVRPEVHMQLRDDQFIMLCGDLDPNYREMQDGTAARILQQLLSESNHRLTYANARLKEADRIADYASRLSDAAVQELEVIHG